MVDYNNFAKTFSNSRKNMKWEEIDYFLDNYFKEELPWKILDIWCWNWRFLWALKNKFSEINNKNYIWVDLSIWLLEEAKKIHTDFEENFLELNMLDIDSPLLTKEGTRGLSNIFFIASFHHLNNIEDREEVIKKAYDLLEDWWRIFMTNWALNSELNKKRYSAAIMNNEEIIEMFWKDISTKNFNSVEFNIKLWDNDRYYHCFDLKELEYLAEKNNFKIIENRIFDNKRNFITILEK